MSLMPGIRLGPYEIVSALGAGGMGEVYRAKDTKLNRDVALKILPDTFTHDADRLARFRREAQVLASLNHPHIGAIYGLDEANGQQFLVLELVDGESLDRRIARGSIPVDEALSIANQITEALEAAHEKGIIHRDLKPANIALTRDGSVKVLDFGLAKTTEPASGTSLDVTNSPTVTTPAMMTGIGVILGTAAYMSPEQAKGRPADKRSDVWAFGCVLYEMLTGRRAFAGDNASETIAAILRDNPDWTALSGVPAGIVSLLRHCLDKDRNRRPRDLADIRMWIDETLASPGTAAAATSSLPQRDGRAIWILGAAAAIAIGALAVPAVRYFRLGKPDAAVTRFEVATPPTTQPYSFAVSPDGRQLVCVANGEKGRQLWLRPLDSVAARPLTGTEGAAAPFWSPDSRAIAFFANGKLQRVDVDAGVPQVVTDPAGGGEGGGTWSKDGVIVFSVSGARSNGGLMRVSAGGGVAVPLTRTVGFQTIHTWPQFLGDGRRLLFFESSNQSQSSGVDLIGLDGGEPRRVLASSAAAVYASGHLLFVSEGVLVAQPFDETRGTLSGAPIAIARGVGPNDGWGRSAFSLSASGVLAHRAGTVVPRQLVWLDRAGTVWGTVGPVDENTPLSHSLSLDGRRIVTTRSVQGNADLWIMDVDRGVFTRFTFDPASDISPLWSADGTQVVFRSSRLGVSDLFIKPASGVSEEQPLLVTPEGKMPVDWSRDGRFLMFVVDSPKTSADLWVLPMMGDRKPFPVLDTRFRESEGQFSPNGRWISYTSNESSRNEVYIRTFPDAGGKWQVSTTGGTSSRWSPDGRELFYLSPDRRLMSARIEVAPDGRSIKPGEPVPLFTMPTGPALGGGTYSRANYSVGPDGRFLINIDAEKPLMSPITVVLNWQSALAAREKP
jgi:eukaryotic-like serine/threonine-protein kinase